MAGTEETIAAGAAAGDAEGGDGSPSSSSSSAGVESGESGSGLNKPATAVKFGIYERDTYWPDCFPRRSNK